MQIRVENLKVGITIWMSDSGNIDFFTITKIEVEANFACVYSLNRIGVRFYHILFLRSMMNVFSS